MKVISEDPSIVIPDIRESDMEQNIVVAATGDTVVAIAVRTPDNNVAWLGGSRNNYHVQILGSESDRFNSMIDMLIDDFARYGSRTFYAVLENPDDMETFIRNYRIRNGVFITILHIMASRWK